MEKPNEDTELVTEDRIHLSCKGRETALWGAEEKAILIDVPTSYGADTRIYEYSTSDKLYRYVCGPTYQCFTSIGPQLIKEAGYHKSGEVNLSIETLINRSMGSITKTVNYGGGNITKFEGVCEPVAPPEPVPAKF